MPAATFAGLSYTIWTADGSSTTYSPSFSWIEDDHLIVKLGGTEMTADVDYTLVNEAIVFTTAPTAGLQVQARRMTPRQLNERLVDFRSFGQITEAEMDLNQQQIWYLIQEAIETDDSGEINPEAEYLQWDGLNSVWTALRSSATQRIANVEDPAEDTDAATKGYVDDIAEWGSAGVPQSWTFTAGVAQTQYTLTGGAFLDQNYLIVSIEGVLQTPGVDFTVNSGSPNSELVFATNQAATGQTITVQNFGKARFLNSLLLTNNSIGTQHVRDGAVTTAKLAPSAVTEEKLADLAITTAKIASGAVTEAKLADDSVTFAKLKDTGFTTAPGGSYDAYLKVDRTTGNLSVATAAVDDLPDWLTELANVRITQLAVPNTNLNMNSNRITNVTNPTGAQDAATKDYVDTAVGSGGGSRIDLLYDATTGAAATAHTLFGGASAPSWLTDSTYLFYTVVVSNFSWSGANLSVKFYEGGGWVLDNEFTSQAVPTDRRGIVSFKLWQPRDGTTRAYAIPDHGGVINSGTVGYGPISGVRFEGDNGASTIGANLRVMVYGHRALT